jgi:hypothetical protein
MDNQLIINYVNNQILEEFGDCGIRAVESDDPECQFMVELPDDAIPLEHTMVIQFIENLDFSMDDVSHPNDNYIH